MIDPEHLNDLCEMTVGCAERAAFLYAAKADGFTEASFPAPMLDLYALLVATVGENCTTQHVSCAVCIGMDSHDERSDPEDNVIEGDFDPGDDIEGSPYQVVPIERYVHEAAAALAAITKYQIGERVLVGQRRATAVPAVIVGQVDEDWWLVADTSGGTPREVDFGRMWHAPLAQPIPFRDRRDDNPGGAS